MAETLLDKSLSKINILFRCSGTNIAIGKAAPTHTKRNRCIYSFNFIWQNTDVLGAIYWFISGLKSGKSFTELTFIAPCIILSFLSVMKSISIIIYEKKVYQLIKNLRMMEAHERNRENTTERGKITEKGVNFLNLVINVLYVFNMLVLVCFALNPLILMILNYMKTNEIDFILPFPIAYPFDPYNIKVWPMVYLRQIWTEIVVVLNTIAPDFVFCIFCSHITIQFRLLQYDIEHVITGTRKSIYNDEMRGGRIRNKLIEIIKWHQELITCVNLLENIYSVSTLYNFISSSVIICLSGFNVTENKDIVLVISFIAFLFMGLLQIFFFCFFGDMLIHASIEVSDAVYNSKWYLAPPKMRKTLLLIQTRC
ncbi:odorant receptor 4 isoform X2 [Manduca sexta]|uniref:odorant receptor 4 isoform X2 n=1 Tax=Manduca sexta TaxID=7130 RepID=UPI0011825B34|nr:odorant receptor 4 isoform X2 [Manduca sexta]